RLVRRYLLAFLFQPAGDGALGDALAELRHKYGDRHVGDNSLRVEVQWLAGERQMRLADDLGLGRVRVDERGDVIRLRVPVDDELRLGDQLADPAADEVYAEHPARLPAGRRRRLGDHLGLALRLEDDRLAVAPARVVHLDHVDAALRGLGRGDADRGALRLGVGDARPPAVVDRPPVEPADLLGHEDALGEADVRELRGGDEVADREDVRHRRPAVPG